MAQTPEQRLRNAKFTKAQDARRGKPESDIKVKRDVKSPVSPIVVGVFAFVLIGGLFFELMSRFFF